jgi:hypothetical protein
VVVATLGRLWELISGNDPHLKDLSLLRFLVLDEADRYEGSLSLVLFVSRLSYGVCRLVSTPFYVYPDLSSPSCIVSYALNRYVFWRVSM